MSLPDHLLNPDDDPRFCSRCEAEYAGKHCPECAAIEADRRHDEDKEEQHHE